MIINLDRADKIIRIHSDICLMCGKGFSNKKGEEDLNLSDHHGIPGKMKPVYSIIIPIHVKCHRKINSNFLLKQEFIKIEDKVKSLNADFLRIKNGLNIEELKEEK